MSDTNVSFTEQTDATSKPETVATIKADAPSKSALHPNQGGNRGGFGGTNKGYVPTPEEVAYHEKIRLENEE